ncbi:hypothetical protein B0T19DRAFT_428051, partial [Cercophora scortea]
MGEGSDLDHFGFSSFSFLIAFWVPLGLGGGQASFSLFSFPSHPTGRTTCPVLGGINAASHGGNYSSRNAFYIC